MSKAEKMTFPRWFAVVSLPIGFLIVHVGPPWALSLLSVRHGWVNDRPGPLNVLAFAMVVAGAAIIGWGAILHLQRTPDHYHIEKTPAYLLLGGLYGRSRNPIYVGVLILWLGWALFYGSVALAVAFIAVLLIVTSIVVPWEERELETRFGESYLEYKRSVPRWIWRAR